MDNHEIIDNLMSQLVNVASTVKQQVREGDGPEETKRSLLRALSESLRGSKDELDGQSYEEEQVTCHPLGTGPSVMWKLLSEHRLRVMTQQPFPHLSSLAPELIVMIIRYAFVGVNHEWRFGTSKHVSVETYINLADMLMPPVRLNPLPKALLLDRHIFDITLPEHIQACKFKAVNTVHPRKSNANQDLHLKVARGRRELPRVPRH